MSFESSKRVDWLVEWFRHARDCGTQGEFEKVCQTVQPPLTSFERIEIKDRTSVFSKRE